MKFTFKYLFSVQSLRFQLKILLNQVGGNDKLACQKAVIGNDEFVDLFIMGVLGVGCCR